MIWGVLNDTLTQLGVRHARQHLIMGFTLHYPVEFPVLNFFIELVR